ncbi:hypothetical protein U1Q18_014902, partial [Sarracenia purpurea var. burkii]
SEVVFITNKGVDAGAGFQRGDHRACRVLVFTEEEVAFGKEIIQRTMQRKIYRKIGEKICTGAV